MRTLKIQNGHQGTPKTPIGFGKGCTPVILGAPFNFPKTVFLGASTPSMRKVDEGGNRKTVRKKIISEILPANLMPVEPLNPGLLTEGAVHK